jgi:predicted N-acetyltransferase YhbS
MRRNMPPTIPVLVLGRLAVDRQYRGHGIGGALLKDGIARAVNTSVQIGAMVHAIDGEAVPFYVKYGFQVFPERSLTLDLTIATATAAM